MIINCVSAVHHLYNISSSNEIINLMHNSGKIIYNKKITILTCQSYYMTSGSNWSKSQFAYLEFTSAHFSEG